MAEAARIRTDAGKKVELRVGFSSTADLQNGQARLSACPTRRSWSPYASWDRASNPGGARWDAGDFNTAECVRASRTEGDFIFFDVTRWYLDYVRARNQNFGLVVIADAPVTIAGDGSGTLAPELRWETTTQPRTSR